MQLARFHIFATALTAAAALALTACASAPEGSADDPEDVAASSDELAAVGQSLAGSFYWRPSDSGAFLDFGQLNLKADGTYTAEVDSTLVNPSVLCIHFPCTLPEEGRWSSVKVFGRTALRVRPSTGSARAYWATLSSDKEILSLARLGKRTNLYRALPSCANVRCATGTHCEMSGTPSLAQCVPDQAPCMKTGCSGQVCSDLNIITTCEFRPEYACYQQATCERQASGQCGFTQTPALAACLENP